MRGTGARGGRHRVRLYETMTTEQLIELQQSICDDPQSKEGAIGCWIFNKKTRKKLADIQQAIAWHMEAKREADGDPVPCNGYSGRQSNRR